MRKRIFTILLLGSLGTMMILSFNRDFTRLTVVQFWKGEEIEVEPLNIASASSSCNNSARNATDCAVIKSSIYDQMIYIMAAYVTSSSAIRLTAIAKCQTNVRLNLHLKLNESAYAVIPLIQQPILPCPWFFAKKCDFVGYFAKTSNSIILKKLLIRQDGKLPEAYILRRDHPSLQIPITLRDARVIPGVTRRHYLAVCLQPIFLLADWTLLVQFFEIWITQGVTKFFIYVHSMTPEVDALLRVYERSTDIEVERIHWAPLPTIINESSEADPNLRVYRTEVATSINDCILRSRKEAEYVISSDLDEVIVVYEASSLSHFLHNLQKKYERSAAFIIRSSFALFENHWANISNPNEIDFSNFANILLENYTWPKGSRSKIIVRPEYVYSAHVHDVLSVDRGKLITTVSPKTARVFHLRRIMQDKLLSSKSVMKTNALARFVNPCNKSWKNRLQTIQQLPDVKILHGNTWPQRGVQVMKELENCRVQLQSVQNCSCNSIYLCSSKITSVDTDEWVLGKQAWTTL